MKAKDVVGKKILRVVQEKFWNEHIGKWSFDVKGFELEGGGFVSFSTTETGSDYATSATYWSAKERNEQT